MLLILSSCDGSDKPASNLAGNWLIIYPEHRLRTSGEREIYGRHQDSIVSLLGLKLVSFDKAGRFTDMDSSGRAAGTWSVSQDSLLRITGGGKGFDPFLATCHRFEKETLQLAQLIPLEGKRIRVMWHLKKIAADAPAARLFTPEANRWRLRPAKPESLPGMQHRLASMLDYYGDYFALVAVESIYFSPARVPLPLNYYQHSLGVSGTLKPSFKALFYNDDDALKAGDLLRNALRASAGEFEQAETFSHEYGLFLKKLARRLAAGTAAR
ncbi:MAG: hypothetical protein JWP27_1657 [Flaviaesturariibacter sp.]|nr:hypothetical protein [Flaviaesturariibacter sp.]